MLSKKEVQMHRLICEARDEASEMRAHAAQLVVERVADEVAADNAWQVLGRNGQQGREHECGSRTT